MSLGIPIQKKNIPYLLLLGTYLSLVLFAAVFIVTPSVSAGTGIFCKNGAEYPAVQGGSGPEAWCNLNGRGGLASTTTKVMCRNPLTEWPADSGISAEEYCADKGGILSNENSSSGVVCRQGQEWDPGSGITPEQFCSGYGGILPSTNPNSGGSNNNNTVECNITSFESGSKGCIIQATIVDESAENGQYQCGMGDKAIKVSFNIGCRGANNTEEVTPLEDMLFAILRFISAGVGLIVVGSTIVGGIQYTASQGNPQQTQAAIKRIQASVGALLLYGFAYALINWIVPGGILR